MDVSCITMKRATCGECNKSTLPLTPTSILHTYTDKYRRTFASNVHKIEIAAHPEDPAQLFDSSNTTKFPTMFGFESWMAADSSAFLQQKLGDVVREAGRVIERIFPESEEVIVARCSEVRCFTRRAKYEVGNHDEFTYWSLPDWVPWERKEHHEQPAERPIVDMTPASYALMKTLAEQLDDSKRPGEPTPEPTRGRGHLRHSRNARDRETEKTAANRSLPLSMWDTADDNVFAHAMMALRGPRSGRR